MKQALRVRFQNVREIRMGSPYNLCDIKFEGEWIPPLPKEDGQNLKAHSPDNRYLALVQWNTTNNQPGFHIVRLDTHRKKYHKTKRIMGLCKKLYWDNDQFVWIKDTLTP
jgi:hypothetical protein